MEFEAPRVAEVVHDRLFGEVAYLATIRADGSPRLHPVTLKRFDRGIGLYMNAGSPKLNDLLRDPRCTLHAPVPDSTGAHAEVLLRCTSKAPAEAPELDPAETVRVPLDVYEALVLSREDGKMSVSRWPATPNAPLTGQSTLEETRRQWMAVTESGDTENYASLLEPDAIWVPPGLPPMRGAGVILQSMRASFNDAKFQLELSPGEVITVHDLAFDRGTFRAHRTPVGGGNTFVHDGRYAMTWKRRSGAWRIYRYADQSDTSTWLDWPLQQRASDAAAYRGDV